MLWGVLRLGGRPGERHRATACRRTRAVAARPGRRGSRAALRLGLQLADQLAGRGQVGHVAQADQHHLGGRTAVGRLLHLGGTFEQHLPGAGQHRDGEQVRQRAAAHPLDLRQVRRLAQLRHGLQAGQRVGQLHQVAQQNAEVGAQRVGAVGDRQHVGGAAGHGGFHQVEHHAAVGDAQHVGNRGGGDGAAGTRALRGPVLGIAARAADTRRAQTLHAQTLRAQTLRA